MDDIIIRGGRIVDGTGTPARNGDVAIKDGVITAVGKVDGQAKRTINADGALVTPGFIDVHTHFDGQYLWDDTLDPSFSNGVTTSIAGNCGVGFAPVHAEHHRMLIELMEGVEDIPGIVLEEGLDWQWKTFPDYMNRLGARKYTMDIGMQMTHAPLRVFVMGERAVNHEVATDADIAEMTRLVKEGMKAGALGFSAARFKSHRSTTGAYVPGTFSKDEELMALAMAMASEGRGVFQIVPHGAGGDAMGEPATRDERLDEHERLVRIARATGRPVTYALLQFNNDPADWKMMLDAAERANAEGLRMHPQTLARPAGAVATIEGYHPFLLRPSYLEVAHLPVTERLAALRNPERRAAILREENSKSGASVNKGTAIVVDGMNAMLPGMYLMARPVDYEPTADKTVSATAKRTGQTLEEVIYDHLVAEKDNFACTFAGNYGNSSLETAREMLSHPCVIASMSDAGAHVKYVCDGAMPTFQLMFWSRDRVRGPRIPLEFMVKKATLDCASLYDFKDRGVLAPGKRADVNVIDYDRLSIDMPHMVYDLPSGGGRLMQMGTGYLATMVAGQITRENDQDTGARPGRLMRA
jgi:N-acyl-D-aspartate/D-glutamate deacylase